MKTLESKPNVKNETESIRKAVIRSYELMPTIFSSYYFCKFVRIESGRDHVMDGTILRVLRMCREDYPYICVDRRMGIYRKK